VPRAISPKTSEPSNPPANAGPTPEDRKMIKGTTRTAAALFGLALPALAAGAQKKMDRGLRDQAIEACVDIREQVLACDKEFADLFVKDLPADRQSAARGKVLEEIAANGGGPLEPRRARCAERVDQQPPTTSDRLSALRRLLSDCRAKPDCQERSRCLWPVVTLLRQR
jgi:hypothetical protein